MSRGFGENPADATAQSAQLVLMGTTTAQAVLQLEPTDRVVVLSTTTDFVVPDPTSTATDILPIEPPEPTVTHTPQPSETPEPTSTHTPSPTATDLPTSTPTPSLTPTSTPFVPQTVNDHIWIEIPGRPLHDGSG